MDETNWYSKKIGKNIDEFDMFDKYITDVLKEFVKEQKQTISVTRSCKSDSEQLVCDEHDYDSYSGGTCKKCGALDSSEAN